jgi:hypothetical protein
MAQRRDNKAKVAAKSFSRPKTLKRDIKKNIGDALTQAFRRLPVGANHAFAPRGPAPLDSAIVRDLANSALRACPEKVARLFRSGHAPDL